MPKFSRYAIPAMFAGLILAALYALFSASSNGSNTDPVIKFATGTLADLDTTERSDPAPTAKFVGEDGASVSLQDFEGELLLVNFWATWCAPCEREMPSLAALQTAREDKGVRVLAISVDQPEDRDYARQRLRELSGGVLEFYTILPEPDGWNIVYDSGADGGFPTTILYARSGAKIAQLAGEADWASYEAIGLIDALLKE